MTQAPHAAPQSATTAPEMAPSSHEEMIAGYGTVTVVTGFVPGVDRLLLDFDTGHGAPKLSLNTQVEPGSTAVMGDGRLMVMLRGVTGVATQDIVLRERAPDTINGVRVVEGFDPDDDVIEVLFDPNEHQPPVIEVRDFEDRSGAEIIYNGRPILAVRGAQGLTPEEVILVPRLKN